MKIVIGGQVDKKEVEALVKEHGPNGVETSIKSDVEAAMAVKTGQAEYYVGACHTGGGGALAMAIAIIGKPSCETVSMPGRKPSEEKIQQAVKEGKKAFGFTADHMETVVPMIMRAIKAL
ncbi:MULTISPECIES: DUF2620 domain-containing protein [Bacillaceae]|uniref:DUF2620 domain-containing protein n=1 Tax=Bacillales TaxID=1385 RepID=UPI0018840476|nr:MULTISPECIES: DUF2620 domain-containing protein [Bacillaceae]MBF0705501.1 DUF2620 domain-containing protein [Pseudalkalibacillus hwajinpoensis]MDO6657716.1 DUF2620 domain-containing protein [Anaerobacillus sp. 1_MG-2023]